MKPELANALRVIRGSLQYHVQQQFNGYGVAAEALSLLPVVEYALRQLEPEPVPTREQLIQCLTLALEAAERKAR